MISTVSLVLFSLLLVNIIIIVHSAPIKIISLPKKASFKSIDLVKPSITSLFAIGSESNEDDDIKIEHKLHPKVKETPAQIHDNVDQSVDTNYLKVFTDIKMNPNELVNSARKRRSIYLNDKTNQRHKRALSTYDFYNTNPFYDQQEFVRPTRASAPMYWYPPLFTRNIRSALASFYEPSEWNKVYADTIENDEDPFFLDDDDDENDEYNRYPILLNLLNIPYDNLQLQQEYNIDNLPIDEDDEFFSTHYGPIENYFK